MEHHWFALQVHTGREKWVASHLANSNLNQILLLQKERRDWSDRQKIIEAPIFPGYVFCQFESSTRTRVLSTPGVLRVVGAGKTPIPIAFEEIEALRILARSERPLERWPYLREGNRIRIEGGSLDGLTGHFVAAKKGGRIVVTVSLLQRSVAVEVDQVRLKAMA
jgi:transcription antitermination factor NusG